MSIPLKHHYLPQFYLQKWAERDGKLLEYRRIRGRLVSRRKYPSQTGFERELYAIRSRSHPEARQKLESALLAPLDSIAAEALRHLEHDGSIPDDMRLRAGWTRFLMSLMHRSPHRMSSLRQQIIDTERTMRPELETQYQALKKQSDPPTFEEYLQGKDTSLMEEALSVLLQKVVNSNRIGRTLGNMVWGHVRLQRSRFGLLTGDTPLLMSNGLGHRQSFVMLPLSPESFFIAAPSVELVRQIINQPTKTLESTLNNVVSRQAQHVVIAADDSQRRFVDARLLKGQGLQLPRTLGHIGLSV